MSFAIRTAFLLAACSLSLFAQTYNFQAFSVPHPANNATSAWGIDNRGAIAGFFSFAVLDSHGNVVPANRGFKRDANGVFEYPIIAPTDDTHTTIATGIDDSGTIVGYSFDQQNNFHGFLLTGGKHGDFTTIDEPPGPSTWVFGINNLGDFAGATGPGLPLHGFVSRSGIVTQIDFPGALGTEANAVASDGTVIGCYGTASGAFAFLRGPKGNFLGLQVAGAAQTCALGISNEAGIIVGYYRDSSNGYHGIVYNYVADLAVRGDGASGSARSVPVEVIDYPGAIQTELTGINAQGVIAGWAQPAKGYGFSFIATPVR